SVFSGASREAPRCAMISTGRAIVEKLPHAQRLAHTPGLRIAPALGVRCVVIGDFGNLAEAVFVEQPFHAREIMPGGGHGGRLELPGACGGFAENREGPRPAGAVVKKWCRGGAF